MRRDLDRLRLVVRPDHSIAELDSIMIEVERWLLRIGRGQTQDARSRLFKHILGCSLIDDPQAVIVAASRYASDEAIRDFQLAAIDTASECFERFMRIVPRTAYAQDCLNEALLQTTWCAIAVGKVRTPARRQDAQFLCLNVEYGRSARGS